MATAPLAEDLVRALEGAIDWHPFPGPQSEAYSSPADILLYGGAAGGGKTDLGVGLALTKHRRSILFRREFPQLKGMQERLEALIGARGRYNGTEHVWRLDSGRLIELGAVQFLKDREKYQGRPHDLLYFDEGAQFLEMQFRFLIGWCRTELVGQRCRVVIGSNPPVTSEGEWLISFFGPWLSDQHPRPALPGELRWFAMLQDGNGKPADIEVEGGEPFEHQGETITPLSRTFIPARVEDNPVYMATGYKATLQALPEPLRSQMLRGDFLAGAEDNPFQVIPTAWVKAANDRWRALAAAGFRPGPQSSVGFDVARGGKDQNVGAARHGAWYAPLRKWPGKVTPSGDDAATLARSILRDQAHVNIDVIGIGASAYDFLRKARVPVVGVNFAEKSLRSDGQPHTDSTGKLLMRNVRAWAYWAFREALDPDTGSNVALPPDDELLADLCAPHWELTANGVLVEAKDDIVARLHRSPDCGDAVVLAWLPTTPPAVSFAASGTRTWRGGADL